MMTTILMFSLLALLPVAWVLHINAKDRKQFEKELEQNLRDDPEGRF